MPKVYLLDGEGKSSRRSWCMMLPGYQKLAWIGPLIPGDSGRWNPVPEKGSVVVGHQLADDEKAAVAQLRQSGVYVILVSLSPGQGLLPDGLYQRKQPVQHGADTHFHACFSRFLEDLTKKNGTPNWALLEPDARRVPENVLACYICVIGGVPTVDAWKTGFEDEIEYWVRTVGIPLKLSWEKDRNNADRLHAFLTATQTLLEGSVREESRDRG